ncbi:sugar phosphate isomerase/epimerase [Halobacillus shinanisalinarum]|uniref:Sugar phosphate isomerase/epimerase n=1 Tax=Halobacillus shinanisalinarum TaxID=2932258 RepID=A0ABY4GYY6_9BACI|nr:sugar phosphate isomerase/epimerase [Halobacillus shinanisalinarum]UOQ93304.1 sugar phosphate isomerase/epimerase [Halobacillus shinanisalinarum]
MLNIPVGLQMFTLRNESEKDFIGTLERVADIGFQGVEFAGYGGMEAKDLRRTIDQLGLKAASSHIPITSIESEIGEVIQAQQILGSKHIVCPHLPVERRSDEDYHKLVKILNEAGRKCQEEGITLSYHNHDFELRQMNDGKTPLEFLLTETNHEWVKAEFDIYWLTKAGESPVKWLSKYEERTPLVHLKDMTTDGERFFAELGTGGVDIESVLNRAESNNVEWWIVEQDQSRRSPFESISKSLRYLREQNVTSI